MSGGVLITYSHGENAAGLVLSAVKVVTGIPAPGALGFLVVAGLAGKTRRRS